MTDPGTDRVVVGNLRVARSLHDFITNEALPGTGIDPDSFWSGVDKVVTAAEETVAAGVPDFHGDNGQDGFVVSRERLAVGPVGLVQAVAVEVVEDEAAEGGGDGEAEVDGQIGVGVGGIVRGGIEAGFGGACGGEAGVK